MKDQYFGDIGDYGKYGLLQFLAEHGISIAVNWYLTENDRSTDGKFTEYLETGQYRECSPALFDTLKKYVVEQDRRDVSVMNEIDLIPNIKYFTERMPASKTIPAAERKACREAWHQRALSFCDGANLVFLDPDNGIRSEEKAVLPRDNKYVFLREAADYYKRGQNVVYYCHKGRRTTDPWKAYKNLLREELPAADLAGLTYHHGTQRSYIFALQPDSAANMKELLRAFLASPWGSKGMFTDEPV